jgi:hypothetical protein
MEQLNVNWGKPYKTDSIWQRDWLIPQELRFNFFDYWKKNNFSLKAQGYSVTKKNEEWFLIETKARKLLFDAPVDVGTKHEELLETTPLKDPSGLRPWQVSAAEKICASIKKWGAAIDGSDVGVGKTYNACGVARELDMDILVVCPKAVMESWRRVIKNHFKMNHKLVGVINYEMLRTGRKDSPYASYIKRRETRRKEFVWKIPKNTLIIWMKVRN